MLAHEQPESNGEEPPAGERASAVAETQPGPRRPTVAAAVITFNEENNIAECLATLGWADEIVVMDSGSGDGTVALARRHPSRLFVRPFDDFPRQRNATLAVIESDWVLFVDADERVSAELAEEVRSTVAAAEEAWRQRPEAAPAGYWVPRQNWILGRWIKHGGWYPDCQLRLLKVGRARYDEARKVHELVNLDGGEGYLSRPFLHYNYRNLGQVFAKQAAYAALEARSLHDRGTRARPHNFLLQPLREFRRRYFAMKGYRDGVHGLFLCGIVAAYVAVVYWHLWRLAGVAPANRG